MVVYVIKDYKTNRLFGIYSSMEKAKKAAEEFHVYMNKIIDGGNWKNEKNEHEVLYGNEDHPQIIHVTKLEVDKCLMHNGNWGNS